MDGHDFAADAAAAGAAALMVEHALDVDLPQIVVADVRAAMGTVAALAAGRPSDALDVVGITGTNGKTTVTQLLARVLDGDGRRVEVLGTLTGPRTTPEAPDLQRQLAEWRDEGVTDVVMEVSSHALALHRVDGTRFRVAVFTNLSRDHLDFHHSMEDYFEAKARLFQPERCDRAVVNLDSAHGRLLRDAELVPTSGYGLDQAQDLHLRIDGSTFRWRGETVQLGLAGRFNVSNALAAAETARLLGVHDATIAAGLSGPFAVPGRFEVVSGNDPVAVVVDYAHTPDGLEQVLQTAREVIPAGAVHVVFGCGGNRDTTKRPVMGEVAAHGADRVILTADNSRGEDTDAIIEAIRDGFAQAAHPRAATLVVEPDRRAAIAVALAGAEAGDVVVIAGKGHEATLTIGDQAVDFDDRVVAGQLLQQLRGTAP